MILVELANKRATLKLAEAIEGTRRKLPRELATAINVTEKIVRKEMAILIRTELAAKAGDVKKHLRQSKRATPSSLHGQATLHKSSRLPIKAFNPRQIAKGVSYKISKKKGRSFRFHAFMGPRPGAVALKLHGHAWKRAGKPKLPIHKLHGVSPWGVYKKKRMRRITVREGKKELHNQIQRRVKFVLLKKAGLI